MGSSPSHRRPRRPSQCRSSVAAVLTLLSYEETIDVDNAAALVIMHAHHTSVDVSYKKLISVLSALTRPLTRVLVRGCRTQPEVDLLTAFGAIRTVGAVPLL
jgi:hypothetical protein